MTPRPPRYHGQPAFSAELKAWRKVAHLSQSDLADLLGATKQTIIRWEAGAVPSGKAGNDYDALERGDLLKRLDQEAGELGKRRQRLEQFLAKLETHQPTRST